jgi:hypothetical protein
LIADVLVALLMNTFLSPLLCFVTTRHKSTSSAWKILVLAILLSLLQSLHEKPTDSWVGAVRSGRLLDQIVSRLRFKRRGQVYHLGLLQEGSEVNLGPVVRRLYCRAVFE